MCPPGEQQAGNTCVPAPVQPRCDPPFVGNKPNCACPPGQQRQGNTCVAAPPPRPTCGAGQELDAASNTCKACPLVDVCDKFKPGAPGTLGGTCIQSHKEPACGPGLIVR